MRDIISIIFDAILVATFQRGGFGRREQHPFGGGLQRDGPGRLPPAGTS